MWRVLSVIGSVSSAPHLTLSALFPRCTSLPSGVREAVPGCCLLVAPAFPLDVLPSFSSVTFSLGLCHNMHIAKRPLSWFRVAFRLKQKFRNCVLMKETIFCFEVQTTASCSHLSTLSCSAPALDRSDDLPRFLRRKQCQMYP